MSEAPPYSDAHQFRVLDLLAAAPRAHTHHIPMHTNSFLQKAMAARPFGQARSPARTSALLIQGHLARGAGVPPS